MREIEGGNIEIIDRNLYVIHLALSLRNPSFMEFSPFASSLIEEFFKVVWLCDEETAIRLGIEHWYRKWNEIRRHRPPLHIAFCWRGGSETHTRAIASSAAETGSG